MKTQKVFTIISAVILALQVIAEALALTVLLQLNMLPGKFLIVVIAAFVLLVALTAGLLFLHGKKTVSLARRIIGWVLAILIILACLLVSKLAYDAYKTIDEVTTPPTSIQEMYVLVREDDPAQTIADTKLYPFGIIADYDVDHTQRAILQIQELTGETLNVVSFERIAEIADGLLNDQVDAVIMNGAALALLIEDEAYEDFLQKARILHTFLLASLEETEPTTEPPTEPEEKNITEDPFVIYFSGSDTRNKKLRTSRSDVNILAVVNPETKQILLINTPRDYYVPNPAGKGQRDKLTHCGLYGPSNSMKALGDLYGLEVEYYAQVNFTGFETLVDAVGGVTIYLDSSLGGMKKGEQKLNGKDALWVARQRYLAAGGDRGRGKNQMKIITAIVDKLTTGTTLISGYSKILKSLEGFFRTNVSSEEISELVKMQLSDMAKWNIVSYAVSGKGGSEKNYSSPGHRAYVMYPDMKMVEKGTSLAKRILAGETLTEADVK